jgi:hypothetical protein
MSLRNILYVDKNALDNYMSQIEGYTYEEATIVNSVMDEKSGKAGIGIPKTSVEGNIGKQNSESLTKNAKITDASKLDKVIKYLNKEEELKYYECIDENIWNEICRDDFLEVLVTPRFSRIEEVTDAAKKLKSLVDIFQPIVDKPMLDSKTEKALDGFETLSKIKKENSITCVFNFEDKKYPIIAYLDENSLKISKEKFISQSYMLCKVQRKIQKGESIELDEIFENFKSFAINRKQRRKMPKDLSNPEAIKDKIKGPALVVIPIAIYQ